jgi:hypothetical protein
VGCIFVEIWEDGVAICCKKMHNKEEEMEEGQSPGLKLNITDKMTYKIILPVILLVQMRAIRFGFLKLHCNSLDIYRGNFFVGIFMNILYHGVNSIGDAICKSYTLLSLFFILSLQFH